MSAAAQDPPVDAGRYALIGESPDDDSAHLVARFFDAFGRGDAQQMAACYHPMVSYSNPVLPDLRGPMPGAMWSLALSRAPSLRLQWQVAFSDARKAQVTWCAQWRQGRRDLRLDAVSTLSIWGDGIARQVDEFRFSQWAGQTLGLRGRLLAWLPAFRRVVQRRTLAAVQAHRARAAAARVEAAPAGSPVLPESTR